VKVVLTVLALLLAPQVVEDLSWPALLAGLVVGLIIGIFQAATSINEQTLSFIPKLVAIGLTAAVFGGWMINSLVDYTKILYGRIPGLFG